jgi:hypothetical protein
MPLTREETELVTKPCWWVVLLKDEYGTIVDKKLESRHVPTFTQAEDENGQYDVVTCSICGERLLRL